MAGAPTEHAPHGGGAHDEEEHEEHVNHEAWAIPYADMVTLLMALFLMLFAMSTIDLKKFEAIAASLNGELGGAGDAIQPLEGDTGGPDPIDLEGSGGDRKNPGPNNANGSNPIAPSVNPIDTKAERAVEALEREEQLTHARLVEDRSLDRVRAKVQHSARRAGLGGAIGLERTARGLVVTVVSDEVLFEPGSARLQTAGRKVLGVVANAVRGLPNNLMVEGHTDNRPISTPEFPSNWELSTERATQVLRELVERRNIPASRVSAAGYGEHRPVATNATAAGRAHNRRVELVVLSEVPFATAPAVAGPSTPRKPAPVIPDPVDEHEAVTAAPVDEQNANAPAAEAAADH